MSAVVMRRFLSVRKISFGLSQLKAGTLSQPRGADNLTDRPFAFLTQLVLRSGLAFACRASVGTARPRAVQGAFFGARARRLIVGVLRHRIFEKRFARDETSFAARNRRVRQNTFPKIRATAGRDFFFRGKYCCFKTLSIQTVDGNARSPVRRQRALHVGTFIPRRANAHSFSLRSGSARADHASRSVCLS